MSKKDKSQVIDEFETAEVESKGSVPVEAEVETEAEKLEKFKASKRAAAQRFKENRIKEKTERVEKAKAFIEHLKSAGLYDGLTAEDKEFLNNLANPTAVSGNTTSLFKTLFGDNPSVGATFTLNEAFTKTLKGKSNIDHYVKKWAEKGTVVTFKQDADNILNSVYTLESIGSGAANAE